MTDNDVTKKDLLIAALGGCPDSAATADGTIGDLSPHKEVRLPFDVAERVYIKHDGTWYEVVADDDGLTVVEADE